MTLVGVMVLAGCSQVAYVSTAPPPAKREVRVRCAAGKTWVPGAWIYRGGEYRWVPGHCKKKPRPGAIWIPGRWRHGPRGWYWVPGHWRG